MKKTNEIQLPPVQRIPENCQDLVRNLASSAVAVKSGDAIHLLNYIIFECFNQKSDSVIIILKELAQDLGVSKQTISIWNKRLQKEGLLKKVKVDQRVRLMPIDILNPKFILFKDQNFQLRDPLKEIFNRLKILEEKSSFQAD